MLTNMAKYIEIEPFNLIKLNCLMHMTLIVVDLGIKLTSAT